MTSASVLDPAISAVGPPRVVSEPVTARRAIRSEWIKWKSLRSTWVVLGVAVVAMVLFALIQVYETRHLGPKL